MESLLLVFGIIMLVREGSGGFTFLTLMQFILLKSKKVALNHKTAGKHLFKFKI